MNHEDLKPYYKSYLNYLTTYPTLYFFNNPSITALELQFFRENYKFDVVKALAMEKLPPANATVQDIEDYRRNRVPAKTTMGVALDIVDYEITYGEKLMRLVVSDFDDLTSEFSGEDHRELLLRKFLDRECGIDNGKYEELLRDTKILNDINLFINYFRGINPDGRKMPKDINVRMMEESFRTVEEDISAMRTYVLLMNAEV